MGVLDRSTILQSGDMLGPYRVLRMLGQGGFGVTYLAIDTNLDREVAIKEYMPELIASRDPNSSVRPKTYNDQDAFTWGLTRFLDEARTLAKFRHPNIVQVMAVFEENQTAYMVMDYERGQDLKQAFEKPENRSEVFLKKIIGPIINGLAEVHRHGYIHRDIKPANILIREDNSPVLLDFGSARQAVSTRTQALTALVSVGYAPLEQYNDSSDDQQGPWTDIYALGAVLYFAIVGKPPMDSTLRGSAVLNERPDPLKPVSRMVTGQYSHSFCEAIDWALKFKIADRPQSLDEWRGAMFEDDRTVLMPVTGATGQRRKNEFISTDSRKTEPTTAQDQTLIQERSVPSNRSQPAQLTPGTLPRANTGQQKDVRSVPAAEQLLLDDWEPQDEFERHSERVPRRSMRTAEKPAKGKTKITWIFLTCLCFALVAIGFLQRESWFPYSHESDEQVRAGSVDVQEKPNSAELKLSAGVSNNSASENQSSIDARLAEELRKEEEAKWAEEFRQGQSARKAEERDKAEQARRAEQARKAQEADKLEEATQRAQEAIRAEEAKRVQEARQQAEAAQLAEVARRAEEAKRAQEARQQAEAAQLAEVARRAEEAKRVQETKKRAVAVQLAEAAKRAEEAERVQEARQRAEDARLAEVARSAEEARKVQETRQREEAAKRADEARLAEENERAEEARQAEGEKQAAEVREAEKAALDDDQAAGQREIEPEVYRSITNEDMQLVLVRFNDLKTAIEQKNSIAVKNMTVASERMNAYFSYVFSSFSSVDVKLDDIKVQPSMQTIQAVLSVRRLIRSNGDIAFPPPEFRNIKLRSVREQDWSKILW